MAQIKMPRVMVTEPIPRETDPEVLHRHLDRANRRRIEGMIERGMSAMYARPLGGGGGEGETRMSFTLDGSDFEIVIRPYQRMQAVAAPEEEQV